MNKLFYAVSKDDILDIWEREPRDIAYDLEKDGFQLIGTAETYAGAYAILEEAFPDVAQRFRRPD